MSVDVGSALDKRENAERKHMANIPASCSELRAIVVATPSLVTKQLLKILKRPTTTKELVGGAGTRECEDCFEKVEN